MDKLRSKGRSIAAAQRGYIIQRVLVDGWSVRRAAETLDIEETRVTAWLRDYRRHGMAALRDDDTKTERLHRRLWRRLSGGLGRTVAGWWRRQPQREPASCVVLRRTGDDGGKRR
jgi:helix-turn-helix protein